MPKLTSAKDRGVAILLVTFILALATTLVINLTHSTFLHSRAIGLVERELQSEYILKSLVSFGIELIEADQINRTDSYKDVWGQGFRNGQPLPESILQELGFVTNNASLYMEITPENSKLPLRSLILTTGNVRAQWANAFQEIFVELGFNDDLLEEDTTGYFPGRAFLADEMISNLFDYLDDDKESSSPVPGEFPEGIEEQLPSEDIFPRQTPDRMQIADLSRIPGFTPNRIRKLADVFYTSPPQTVAVNINVAPPIVLQALRFEAGDYDVIRNDGPFPNATELGKAVKIPTDLEAAGATNFIGGTSESFRIIAKVDSANQSYFVRALITEDSGDYEIRSIQLF